MQNHWPVLIAAFLISAAVALGLYRRDQIIEAASHRNPIPTAAPSPAPAAPPVNTNGKVEAELPAQAPAAPVAQQGAQPKVAAAPVPPSPTPLPLDPKAMAAAAPKPAPAPAQPAQPAAQPAQPAQPAAQPAKPAPPQQKFILPSSPPAPAHAAQPAQPAQPAIAGGAVPAKPVVAAPAPAALAVSDGAQILFNLRQKIEQAMGRKSTDLATGGYAFQLDGARVEVQPMPTWSIKVYNLGQPAENESDAFKKALNTIGAEIGFDTTQKGTTLSSGKLSLQATTKLGNASVVRDPQNGEVVISPNQHKVIHPAAPVAPAKAAAPAPAPASGAPQTQGNTGPASAPGKQF